MEQNKATRTIEDYVKTRYPITIREYEDGTYYAEIPALPGCMTEADTLEEVYEMINDAKRAWVTTALELGRDIPLPEDEREYSGKFVVRVPVSLHRNLATLADKEGISLNQIVNALLEKNLSLPYLEKQEALLNDLASKIDIAINNRQQVNYDVTVKNSTLEADVRPIRLEKVS